MKRSTSFLSILSMFALFSIIGFSACGTSTNTANTPPAASVVPQSPTPPSTLIPTTGTQGVTVTMSDNGRSVLLKKGQTLLVVLDQVAYDSWTIKVADPTILSALPKNSVPPGAQGLYQASKVGQTSLTASGELKCRKTNPPCQINPKDFQIKVTVE